MPFPYVFPFTFEPPSLVGTSTIDMAFYQHMRRIFYANGRFWVFYTDGTNLVYRTSLDGIIWSATTTVRACLSGAHFSIWFDGSYVHYAYTPASADAPIYYRRGTPNSDGTITWSAAEQIAVAAASGITYNVPNVCVDSGGYPWIGYSWYDGTTYRPYVTKSSRNDGVWETASGFPFNVSTTTGSCNVSVIPLTGQKVVVFSGFSGVTLKIKAWTGSSWLSEISSASPVRGGHSEVAEDDKVHICFTHSTSYDVLHVIYDYPSNSLGSETVVQAATTSLTDPVVARDPTTNTLYCFWAGSPTANHIYYKKHVGGTWDSSPTDWITEPETGDDNPGLTRNDRLQCFYTAYGGFIGLVYMTRTASPYRVKFNYLTLAVAYEITLTESLGLVDRIVEAPSLVKSESLGLVDVYSRTWTVYRTYSELLGLADAVSKEPSKTFSEFLGLVDTVATVKSLFRTCTELLGLADTIIKSPSVIKTESLGLTDAYSRVWTAYRTYSELLGLVDSVQKEPSKTFPESLGLVDTYSRVWSTYRTFSELLGLSDVILKSSAITKTEALGLVDAYSRVWNAYRTYSETLGLADSVFRAVTLHPLTETLGLFDALEKSPSKTFTEALGLLDTVSAIRPLIKVLTETLGLKDTLAKSTSTTRTELLGLRDFTVKDASKTFTEALGLLDTVSAIRPLIKVLTETLGLKDTFSRVWTVQRTYTEALGLKDYVSKSVTLHALVEVLGLLDSIRYGKNLTVLAKLIRKYIQLEDIGGE